MKFLKILIAVIIFLTVLSGLFFLLIFSTQRHHQKIEDINIRYTKKPPYLLAAKPHYTVVTWDIGFATSGNSTDLYFDGGEMSRPEKDSVESWFNAIKDSLISFKNVDFIFLQEIDHHSKRSYYMNQQQLLDTFFPHYASSYAANHHVLFVPVPLKHPYGKISSGMELLSAVYPLESMRVALETKENFFKKPFTQNRCCIVNHYRLRNGKTLVMINVCNNVKELAHDIIALMVTEYEKGNYVMAGGNWGINPVNFSETFFTNIDTAIFNNTSISSGFLPNGWNAYYDDSIPSVRSMNTPYQQGITPVSTTDFFIASPNIQIIETKTIPFDFKYSSHNPVQIKFQLK